MTNTTPKDLQARQWYFDCPQCGHIGMLAALEPHPTRPMPDDLGFCPQCHGEIREMLNETEIRSVLKSYDEDFDEFFSEAWA